MESRLRFESFLRSNAQSAEIDGGVLCLSGLHHPSRRWGVWLVAGRGHFEASRNWGVRETAAITRIASCRIGCLGATTGRDLPGT